MNEQFNIRRRIEIDMAHRIPDHASKCFNLHGHRYVIEATCRGELFTDGEQTGMICDFGFLKQCMMETIYDPCDHGMILYREDPMVGYFQCTLVAPHEVDDTHTNLVSGIKLLKLDCVPTAENLAKYWHEQLEVSIHQFFRNRDETPPTLRRLRVYETPNCMAEYPA